MKKLVSIMDLTAACLTSMAAEKPNVLMIVADDLNDWIGPMGGFRLSWLSHAGNGQRVSRA